MRREQVASGWAEAGSGLRRPDCDPLETDRVETELARPKEAPVVLFEALFTQNQSTPPKVHQHLLVTSRSLLLLITTRSPRPFSLSQRQKSGPATFPRLTIVHTSSLPVQILTMAVLSNARRAASERKMASDAFRRPYKRITRSATRQARNEEASSSSNDSASSSANNTAGPSSSADAANSTSDSSASGDATSTTSGSNASADTTSTASGPTSSVEAANTSDSNASVDTVDTSASNASIDTADTHVDNVLQPKSVNLDKTIESDASDSEDEKPQTKAPTKSKASKKKAKKAKTSKKASSSRSKVNDEDSDYVASDAESESDVLPSDDDAVLPSDDDAASDTSSKPKPNSKKRKRAQSKVKAKAKAKEQRRAAKKTTVEDVEDEEEGGLLKTKAFLYGIQDCSRTDILEGLDLSLDELPELAELQKVLRENIESLDGDGQNVKQLVNGNGEGKDVNAPATKNFDGEDCPCVVAGGSRYYLGSNLARHYDLKSKPASRPRPHGLGSLEATKRLFLDWIDRELGGCSVYAGERLLISFFPFYSHRQG